MKKILLIVGLFVFAFAGKASAQVTYPLSAAVQWDQPAASTDPTQAITGYVVTIDGVATTVTPTTACATLPCSFSFSIPDANSHTVSVASVNMWGQSVPVGFTFAAVVPGKSSNVKVVKK